MRASSLIIDFAFPFFEHELCWYRVILVIVDSRFYDCESSSFPRWFVTTVWLICDMSYDRIWVRTESSITLSWIRINAVIPVQMPLWKIKISEFIRKQIFRSRWNTRIQISCYYNVLAQFRSPHAHTYQYDRRWSPCGGSTALLLHANISIQFFSCLWVLKIATMKSRQEYTDFYYICLIQREIGRAHLWCNVRFTPMAVSVFLLGMM